MNAVHAELVLRQGDFRLDVAFDIPAGSVLAILGPNGSGKSTVLGCLAGLLSPDRGSIVVDGRALTDVHRRVLVPPEARKVGLLAQDPLLFPHLSVLDNVAFAPRSLGASRAVARERAVRWLSEVDAEDLAGRRPAQLSGGQAQRVAVARALAGDPGLLLLDEPLAALDVDAAPAIRGLLRRVLRSPGAAPAAVLVTHDPLDALSLADQVVVLAEGRIVEQGATRDVLSAPRTPFTARIAGVNLVGGIATAGGLRTEGGEVISGLPADDVVVGEPAVAVFAPAAVAVYPAGAAVTGSPRNAAKATVATVAPHGDLVRLHTGGDGQWAAGLTADLTPAAVAELALEPGSEVRLVVKTTMVRVHPVRSAG
ncbi:molybdate transport system ATP-binding protein [Amycolatopsis marina]|uniref:Molybdate transport system ATP-binding protein n=1 Tax=Amycolatopsis marina TaxID=490629 RepID=A0A1I1CN75_9PSEU|nr:ATP-binding cassette domain-containing protein [Amycolatopsis marina]SFB62348.1 molybdate transport system ATP-binding protein [Amycolatopsis marina]